MTKTKIEWCDYTFNPVTGCLHNCEYCYAMKIAKRFGGVDEHISREIPQHMVYIFNNKPTLKGKAAPYPFGFIPTFHRYRLDEPQRVKKPQNVFVCSMADLFGDWVPDEWVQQVFEACEKAPWHRYLFLTKNPKRYIELFKKDILLKKIISGTVQQ